MRGQTRELADLVQAAEDWLEALTCDLPRHPRYRVRVSKLAQVLERLKEGVMALQAQTQGQEPYRCPFCGAELDGPPPEEWERFRHQGGPCGGVPEWHEGPVEEED